MRSLIGDATYNKLVDDGLKLGELRVLFKAMAEAGGVTLPNSRPPQRRVSTRTSKR